RGHAGAAPRPLETGAHAATVWLQQLINGVSLGATYSLVALGYTLVFGTLGIINMAHGEIFMFGAFFGLLLVETGLLSSVGMLAAAAGGAAVMGLLLEYIALRPLRRRQGGHLTPLISTIGVSIFLRSLALQLFGPESQSFPAALKGGSFRLGGTVVTQVDAVILTAALGLMLGLWLLLGRTKLGKAMRATAENQTTAALLGGNTEAIIALTVMLAAALGGVAGALVGLSFAVSPSMGLPYGLKGLSIIVLGGMGNVVGAMVGGLLLGFAEVVTVQLFSSSWRDMAAFALLFLLLVVKPEGLFGRAHQAGGKV